MHRLLIILLVCGMAWPQQNINVNPSRITRSGATTNDLVRFNGTNWVAFTPPSTSFVALSSVTFTHNLNRNYVKVTCYASVTNKWVLPAYVAATSANVVTIVFDDLRSGTCSAR